MGTNLIPLGVTGIRRVATEVDRLALPIPFDDLVYQIEVNSIGSDQEYVK